MLLGLTRCLHKYPCLVIPAKTLLKLSTVHIPMSRAAWLQVTFLVNAQNVKCTFLRRIVFYFISRAQLLLRFCSIIFRFAQLFFIFLHYFICTSYYFYLTYIMFSSAFFFVRNELCQTIFTALYFVYVSILIYYFMHHSILLFY